MAGKTIDEWIELLADRSKPGDIGEYFHREQCAELLEFLKELLERRKAAAKYFGISLDEFDHRYYQ